ncbi:hypothetical protein ACHHYP_05547 [Achlya hypogyna]|uniref:U-box domain-containing protein n=1 Tax=Achlya hypogyna TaxID=1202772 RepID=A0A1V9ZNM5_ACHHY|nr:hypothetical protein ACHHYP_05547 [Achlya hypogyna]
MNESDLDAFVCPITHEVMEDPVQTEDGTTYERSAIARWLLLRRTSPATNIELLSTTLVPNRALKNALDEFKSLKVSVRNFKTLTAPVATPVSGSYCVFRLLRPSTVYSTASLANPKLLPSGGTWILDANTLVVVTGRWPDDCGFLELGGADESPLCGLFIAENIPDASTPNAVPVAMRNTIAVYNTGPKDSVVRHWPAASVESGSGVCVPPGTVVSTDLQVHDAVMGVSYVRLERSERWLLETDLIKCEMSVVRTICNIVKQSMLRTNAWATVGTPLGVLAANTLVESRCTVGFADKLFCRVTLPTAVGWCCLRPLDRLPQCPPRVAERPAGDSVSVLALYGEYFFLQLLVAQENGLRTVQNLYNVCPGLSDRLASCAADGLVVNHIALGPDDIGYVTAASASCTSRCWASDSAPMAFQRGMTPNARVAFGSNGRYLQLHDSRGIVSDGVKLPLQPQFPKARRVKAFGLHGVHGVFMKVGANMTSAEMPPWFEDDIVNAAPGGNGGLRLGTYSCQS